MQSLSPHVHDLFLSNSMPVRDADSFLYNAPNLGAVGVNRGASGIDGIISSAVGFALATPSPKGSPPLTAVIGGEKRQEVIERREDADPSASNFSHCRMLAAP